MPFANTWNYLQENLFIDDEIENWTAAKNYYGQSFLIVEVNPDYIIVNPPGAANTQNISRSDFENVYNVWAEYCTGEVQRQEIVDITRFSKYIISILHWATELNGGNLL